MSILALIFPDVIFPDVRLTETNDTILKQAWEG